MKHTTKPILPAVLIFALVLTGCPQAGKHSGTGTNPAVSSNPNELTEADVLAAFGLTKGNITASAAAKKIATAAPVAVSGITFTSKTAVSYDDQAGTFTVRMTGTKNGKSFNKTVTFTGFTHPLADKWIQSVDSCELNLDEGIEHNYKLEKYIEEVNKDPSGKKLVKKLSFMLSDSVTTIELGEHDAYTLTAEAKKSGTKVQVQPRVVFRKLAEGGTETLVANTDFGFSHLKTQLTKDYFTDEDVFKYVLAKTVDADAIKADGSKFMKVHVKLKGSEKILTVTADPGY